MRGTNRVTGRLRRWLPRLIPIALAVLLIAINGVIALAYLHDLRLINLGADRSLQTVVALAEVEALAESAGQSLRGYRLSGDAQVLASYRRAQTELSVQLNRLRGTVTDGSGLFKRIDSLTTLNQRSATELAATLTSAESPLRNSHLAQQLVAIADQTDGIVSDLHTMMIDEQGRLHDDIGAIESQDTSSLEVGMIVRTLAIVLVVTAIFMMRNNVRKNEELATAQSTALRESELRSRHIFEESPLGVLLANPDDQRIVEANPAFCRMLGYTSEQIAELTIADITHIDDRELLNEAARHVVEIRYVTSAAVIAWARVSLTQLSACRHRQPLLLGLVEDITREKRAEAELRQAQKMEAIGQLTGGIAHDFNNLLGVILGNAEFLSDAVHHHPDQLALVKEIIDSALSGADLTRRLLAFARRQTLQPRRIDLNTYLPNHVAILRRLLGETVHVTMTLAPDLWPTRVDPSQVGDALLNLTINARDAMPLGGRIQISTANVHLEDDPRDGGGGTRRLRCHDGVRYRHRHAARSAGARGGTVLHHQGTGRRKWAWARHDLRVRQAVRRPYDHRQPARTRHHGAALSAAGAGLGGRRRRRGAGGCRCQGDTRPFCWSMTAMRCASLQAVISTRWAIASPRRRTAPRRWRSCAADRRSTCCSPTSSCPTA